MRFARRGARAAALAAGIAATSCLDASGLASGTVRLGLYPVFEGAAPRAGRDGTPTDVDSFVVIVANPPRADTIVRKLGPGQDTLFIELEIELVQPAWRPAPGARAAAAGPRAERPRWSWQRGRQPRPPAPPRGR